jgi:CHAD domain-containing protein
MVATKQGGDETIALLRQYIREQAGVIERRRVNILQREEVEDVHQMRIATRRLRAALKILERDRLAAEVAWLTHRLGAVRDFDVQLAGDSAKHAPGYRAFLSTQRNLARRKLLRSLQTKRIRRLLDDLTALTQRLGKTAQHAPVDLSRHILKQLEKAAHSGRNITTRTAYRRLHRLRIACKRLRYQVEMAQPTAGSTLHEVMAPLKQTLDDLGELQDSRVAAGHLRAYAASLPPEHPGHANITAEMSAHRHHAKQLRQRMPATWQRMDKPLRRAQRALSRG